MNHGDELRKMALDKNKSSNKNEQTYRYESGYNGAIPLLSEVKNHCSNRFHWSPETASSSNKTVFARSFRRLRPHAEQHMTQEPRMPHATTARIASLPADNIARRISGIRNPIMLSYGKKLKITDLNSCATTLDTSLGNAACQQAIQVVPVCHATRSNAARERFMGVFSKLTRLLFVVTALFLAVFMKPAVALTISEFAIPTASSYPNSIITGSDGNLWFTEYSARKIGKITPAGLVTEYGSLSGQPGSITSGPDGNLWFTVEGEASKIGKITPAGVITEYPLPTAFANPGGIVTGPDGNLWFTEGGIGKIGRITTVGVITEFAIVGCSYCFPVKITAGPDGNLWFTELNAAKIGRITTAGVITEFAVQGSSWPRGITSGPDGNLWFTEDMGNRIGKITTAGVVTEYFISTGTPYTSPSRPMNIAVGPDGNLWFTEGDGNKIGMITTAGVITEYAVPTAASFPLDITTGPDGRIWFLENRSNKVGAVGPVPVRPMLAAGGNHTCALTSGGGVKCWGLNNFGQLGDGSTTDHLNPVDVTGLTSGASAIAAGEFHTCALTAGGGVKCWGFNDYGQLGNNSTTQQLTPVDVTGLTSGVIAIAASRYSTCALTSGGGMKCWGYNAYGQLGDGSTAQRLAPVDVTGLTSGVSAITAGIDHTCALTSGSGVKCWGRNVYGEVGVGDTVQHIFPVDVSGLTSGMSAVGAAYYHTCALTATGGVKCWGYNGEGELGNGAAINQTTPVDVSGLTGGVNYIATGKQHTCALTSGGGVKCWGFNSDGQLGNGNITNQATPVDVSGLTSGVSAIAVGNYHTCALIGGSTVKCWGWNRDGQLGDGSTTNRLTPVDVTGLSLLTSQTITFGAAPSITVGGTGTVSAAATSGLAVTFTSATPGACTVSGSTVTGVAAGTCTIRANQAGNAGYSAAPQATQNITVDKANQSIGPITFTPATLAVGGTTTASATATSGLSVTFRSLTTGICTVSGSTVTGVAAGTCTVVAFQAGNANYDAAPSLSQNITVGKTVQTIGPITFAPATLAAGGATMASATATSGLPVTFSTTSAACTATGTYGKTITGIAVGTCIINASQAGNATYAAAPLRAQTLTVGAAPAPAVSLDRTALTFAARRPGTTGPAQLVTLRNTGTAALGITGIVASGDFARTTTCGATLAAGASCIISVTFTPTAMGARTGAVTLTSNAPGSPHRVTLTGTGQGTRYDINGDGKADIFWRNTTSGANQIWFMNGGIKTGTAAPPAQPAGWSIAGEADFNADGKADLLWRNAAGQNQIWLMNGATRLSATALAPAVAAPWAVAGTGDFNGDGKADLLWRNTTTGANQVWLMNGAARVGVPINTIAQAIAWAVAGIADFNGDGKADLLWRNPVNGQNHIWFMNGAIRTGAQAVPGTILAPWSIAGTGDFNGDGKADILWRNPNTGGNTVWLMNGAAATGTPAAAQAASWQVAGVADFSGDGKADILWRNPSSGATQLWTMNGAVRLGQANLAPAMLPPWAVAK